MFVGLRHTSCNYFWQTLIMHVLNSFIQGLLATQSLLEP
jgi:hypothetical protein